MIDNFKKICLIGWAKSNISLCRVLLKLEKEVRVSEIRDINNFDNFLIDRFSKDGVKFEFSGHTKDFIKDSDLIVLSPGVQLNSSPIQIAKELNIPYVGEIEVAFWLTKARFIAITGTSGKTTTTFLTYKLLKEKFKRVFLGGNIGIPLSSFILKANKNDLIVLEISSFQLQTIMSFRPFVAALLNIEPNHLDHHSSFEEYFSSKMNIFKNQRKEDYAVINKNMFLLKEVEKHIRSNIVYFSKEFPNEDFSCAYRIASIFKVDRTFAINLFSKFKGLSHRMQFIRTINGINFINDSKSTTPLSTIWALKQLKGKTILIAGGKDKGLDYSVIIPHLGNVKKINLIGEASSKIKKTLNGYVSVEIFGSLKDAVISSFKELDKGNILFSPMCSSFDMFSNYKERGRKFIEIVKNIKT